MHRNGTQWQNHKFQFNLFGALTILTVLTITFGECNVIKGRLPQTSLISNFVQHFIQPYIQSLQHSADTPIQRSHTESPVNKAIREVIDNLKPYLQDEDSVHDEKAAFEDNDDTTIIEFLPKTDMLREGENPSTELQTNIHVYEKIKSDIKAALENEGVSERTRKMVTRTLDDLIAQVIRNQCTWKSVEHSSAVFRNGKDATHNVSIEEWEDLKKQYLNFLETKHLNKSMVLFNKFHKFFSKVINDTQTLSNKYKIKCQLIKADEVDDTKLRKGSDDSCLDFKICSEELRDFIKDFYKTLNDTTVSIFKNYAAMYVRDVITDGDDSQDKDSVPNVLENMGHAVDRRVSKVFIQELVKLRLDEKKNKEVNIKILREFIKTTVKRVLKHIKKHLTLDLASLKARLLLAVKQDLNININVELGNLEADIKSRICTVFLTCNGFVTENRRAMSDSKRLQLNRDSVYVKVQLSFDDSLKDDIARANTLLNPRNKIPKNEKMEEHRKYYNNLNVTRTTIGFSITKYTSKNEMEKKNVDAIITNSIVETF